MPIEPLLKIMERLRDRDTGCEWDRVQTYATIAPYTIEEAYEVEDAIARNDLASLKDELGDLLLQVVFHARMAEETGEFDFSDVVQSIVDKMERRHPYIFSDTGLRGNWEDIKAAERLSASEDESALGGVARSLPALMRAQKLQKRAARTGFDWLTAQECLPKVHEELAEFHQAETEDHKHEEAGDLLFAVVNYLRKSGIDCESALRGANAKFERRFRGMESMAKSDFASLALADKEALWQSVKNRE